MPREIIGNVVVANRRTSGEHFIMCSACGRWIDMRDFGSKANIHSASMADSDGGSPGFCA
jgi:hypothetical protein